MTFLVNNTVSNVTLNDGRQFIPRGSFLEVSDEVANCVEAADAVRRGWLVISDTPTVAASKAPEMVITPTPKEQGSTTFPGKEPEAVAEVVTETAEIVVAEDTPKKGSKKTAA